MNIRKRRVLSATLNPSIVTLFKKISFILFGNADAANLFYPPAGCHIMMRDPESTIGKLIDTQKISFIASVDEGGYPNMKAMLAPRKREGIKTFYFTTNTSSMRVRQYNDDPKASVYFFDGRSFRGVMLKGTMEVLTDDVFKEMIWKDGDTMYYKGGVTDPDYCVLRFTATSGRYYSNFSSQDFSV
jgi:general stress protein 26